MKRKIIFVVFILASIIVIWYIENGISSYDMSFYSGKDGGLFMRVKSIIFMSPLFFILMTKENRMFSFILGIFVGVISLMLSFSILYIVFMNGLIFNVFGFLFTIIIFFLIEKYKGFKLTEN